MRLCEGFEFRPRPVIAVQLDVGHGEGKTAAIVERCKRRRLSVGNRRPQVLPVQEKDTSRESEQSEGRRVLSDFVHQDGLGAYVFALFESSFDPSLEGRADLTLGLAAAVEVDLLGCEERTRSGQSKQGSEKNDPTNR